MRLPKIRRVLLVGLLSVCVQVGLRAQLNAPLSMGGLGFDEPRANVTNRAIGGLSNAITDFTSINLVNPASYGYVYDVPSRRILLDAGYALRRYRVQPAGDTTLSSLGTNVTYISLQFPIKRAMGIVLAYQPISIIKSLNTQMLASDVQTTDARGGLSQIMGGWGMKVKKWSFGLSVGYLFGRKEIKLFKTPLISTADLTAVPTEQTNKDFYQGMLLNTGVLFAQKIKNDPNNISHTFLKVGGHIEFAPFIRGTRDSLQLNVASDEARTVLDTASALTSRLPITGYPIKGGLGVVIEKEFAWLVGVDFNYQKWNQFTYGHDYQAGRNTWQLRAGASITPDYKARNFFKRAPLRVGGHFGTSLLGISGRTFTEWGISAGIGIPIKKYSYTNQASMFNFTFEYINRNRPGVIQDHSLNFGFNIIISDLWFVKPYYQ